MTSRPLYPLIAPCRFVDKYGNLRSLGRAMTHPQDSILRASEICMTGGTIDSSIGLVGPAREIRRGTPIRVITLKARQMGVSTFTEAVAFAVSMVLPYSRSLIVSHDNTSSEHLLSMCRRYWDTSLFNADGIFTPKHLAGNKLGWLEQDTEMKISTAKNLSAGRSHTIRFLHASEVAFWDNGFELMKGLNQAVPRVPLSFQYLESTANGIGNYFEQTWNEAVDGANSYLPLFYPWWQHPAYEAQHIGLGHLADRPLMNIDSEEQALSRAFRRMGLDDYTIRAKLLWRREILSTECQGELEVFHQEYPSTPEEAFVATGRNVFNKQHLDAAYEPIEGERGDLHTTKSGRVEFVKDRHGPLTVYRRPTLSGWYMVGADAAKQAKGDYAVIQVIDRVTWEQVATYRVDQDPTTFAEAVIRMGHWYNEAMLVPETNMSGGVVAEICRSRYDNVFIHRSQATVRGQMANQYGFNTNVQTKPEVIGHLKRAVLDRANGQSTFTIHDRTTYLEMKGYVLTDTGQYENGNGTDHDDTVMALALAITATIYEADDDARPDVRANRHRPDTAPEAERWIGAVEGVADGSEVVVKKKVKEAGDDDEGDVTYHLSPARRISQPDDDDEYLYEYDDYQGDPW